MNANHGKAVVFSVRTNNKWHAKEEKMGGEFSAVVCFCVRALNFFTLWFVQSQSLDHFVIDWVASTQKKIVNACESLSILVGKV